MFFKSDKQFGQDERPSADGPPPGRSSDIAEEQLVEQARGLNEDAWAVIYQRHAQQVYAYIYYRLGDQHAAEDLTADVFVKAIAGIKGYAYRGTPLLAWLYRIARNATVDYRKTAAKRAQHQTQDAAEEVEEREDRVQALDERTDMLSAIRALTEDQQQVVILRFYAGMSNAEVARAMGKPEGAVKALQTRALRSLRRLLTEGGLRQESA